MKHVKTATAALIVLTFGLSDAQPGDPNNAQSAPNSPTRPQNRDTPGLRDTPELQNAPGQDVYTRYLAFEHSQGAARAIEKATRKAYEFDYYRSQVQAPDLEVLNVAQTLLSESQASFSSSDFVLAEGQAKAADDLYKAAEHLYSAEGIVFPGEVSGRPRGPGRHGPGGPGRSAFEAPYKAQEELSRLGFELEYYGGENDQIANLQRIAQSLLERVGQAPTLAPTTPPPPRRCARLHGPVRGGRPRPRLRRGRQRGCQGGASPARGSAWFLTCNCWLVSQKV